MCKSSKQGGVLDTHPPPYATRMLGNDLRASSMIDHIASAFLSLKWLGQGLEAESDRWAPAVITVAVVNVAVTSGGTGAPLIGDVGGRVLSQEIYRVRSTR